PPAVGLAQGTPGDVETVPPVLGELRLADDRDERAHRVPVAYRDLRRVGELPRGDAAGPDHELVENGAHESAVNRLPEADVLGAELKVGVHQPAVRMHVETESHRVGRPADEARARLRKRLHGRSLTRGAALEKDAMG